jgi:hypothetical protein
MITLISCVGAEVSWTQTIIKKQIRAIWGYLGLCGAIWGNLGQFQALTKICDLEGCNCLSQSHQQCQKRFSLLLFLKIAHIDHVATLQNGEF